jgi:hypothetical protein
MTPHATDDTNHSKTNGNMSNDSAPLTNGETPRSKSLSVSNSSTCAPHSTQHLLAATVVVQQLS